MLKIFQKTFLIVLTFIAFNAFVSLNRSFAHPIDNTDLYLYYEKEADGQQIALGKLSAYLYINWYQAAALVQNATGKNAFDLDMEQLLTYDDVYQAYVKNHLIINNNDKVCELSFSSIPQDSSRYPLDLGKRIVMSFNCPEKLNNLKIVNTLFLAEFEFSTNYINLFKGEVFIEKIEANKTFTEFLVTINSDGSVNFNKPENFVSTDGNLSPLDPQYSSQTFDNSNSIMKEAPAKLSYLENFQAFFTNIKKIGNVSEMNPFYLFLLLFILGFLHTMEAGHSKVVLSSAMLHKNMDVKGGILYAIVFTVTHIGDILLLGLSLLIVNNFVDVYSKFSMLERFAAYALLFIGVYLLFKSIADYVQFHILKRNTHFRVDSHDHNHSHLQAGALGETNAHSHDFNPHKSFKDQLFVGFLTGLAPCVFGWSILMVIVSAKKLWLLIPAILAFSLGIFLALILVVFLIGKFKSRLLNKIGWLTEISPILSALILTVYAIYIIS